MHRLNLIGHGAVPPPLESSQLSSGHQPVPDPLPHCPTSSSFPPQGLLVEEVPPTDENEGADILPTVSWLDSVTLPTIFTEKLKLTFSLIPPTLAHVVDIRLHSKLVEQFHRWLSSNCFLLSLWNVTFLLLFAIKMFPDQLPFPGLKHWVEFRCSLIQTKSTYLKRGREI